MATHNFFLEENLEAEAYEQLCVEDVHILCPTGKKITKKRIKKFVKKVKKYINRDVFNNSRMYWFEGIGVSDDEKKEYYICWGRRSLVLIIKNFHYFFTYFIREITILNILIWGPIDNVYFHT